MTPRELLRSRFGFADFRPGQQPVIEALLAGQPALAVFPTGGGKSVCCQFPALALEGVCQTPKIDFGTLDSYPTDRYN